MIVGHQNAITYKEIFPLIKDNKIWLGIGFRGGAAHFISNYEDTATANDRKEGMIRVSGVHWFTKLDIAKRHEDLLLYKTYTPEDYPKYDNYDAINVDKTKEIPMNYKGAMGVPITFLDKYNPEQFEILSSNDYRKTKTIPFKSHGLIKDKEGSINGKPKYVRILIKNKRISHGC